MNMYRSRRLLAISVLGVALGGYGLWMASCGVAADPKHSDRVSGTLLPSTPEYKNAVRMRDEFLAMISKLTMASETHIQSNCTNDNIEATCDKVRALVRHIISEYLDVEIVLNMVVNGGVLDLLNLGGGGNPTPEDQERQRILEGFIKDIVNIVLSADKWDPLCTDAGAIRDDILPRSAHVVDWLAKKVVADQLIVHAGTNTATFALRADDICDGTFFPAKFHDLETLYSDKCKWVVEQGAMALVLDNSTSGILHLELVVGAEAPVEIFHADFQSSSSASITFEFAQIPEIIKAYDRDPTEVLGAGYKATGVIGGEAVFRSETEMAVEAYIPADIELRFDLTDFDPTQGDDPTAAEQIAWLEIFAQATDSLIQSDLPPGILAANIDGGRFFVDAQLEQPDSILPDFRVELDRLHANAEAADETRLTNVSLGNQPIRLSSGQQEICTWDLEELEENGSDLALGKEAQAYYGQGLPLFHVVMRCQDDQGALPPIIGAALKNYDLNFPADPKTTLTDNLQFLAWMADIFL